jgi:hypothetical protein
MPLRGHDLPDYAPPAPVPRKAHVFTIANYRHGRPKADWWWEHKCREGYYADAGPYASPKDAYTAAVQHLKGCCR